VLSNQVASIVVLSDKPMASEEEKYHLGVAFEQLSYGGI
jgi:hypothetical protein